MDDDHDVEPLAQGQLVPVDDRAELTLEPVTNHRAFKTPACAQADARLAQRVWQDPDGQRRAAGPPTSSVHGTEGLAVLE